MTIRLSDVADRAGVSTKTVSNVVNGYRHVRPDTRARVLAAIQELDYRPNLSARSLRRGRSGLVALALPALDVPYFGELASAVVASAEERGWTVLVDQTNGVAAREREVARGLRGHLIDGLILSPMALSAEDLERSERDIPMVLLGERMTAGATVDHVAIDNVAAARVATDHLLGLGRRRVAAIGCQSAAHSSSGVAALRREGYEVAVREAGGTTGSGWIPLVADYTRAEGAAAMAGLLDSGDPPDAVFCFSDLLALGALRVLAERGLRVPQDVAVMGFDDIEDGRYSNPSLSTISPDKAAIARLAVEMLDDRIARRGDAAPRELRVGFELVARESTLGLAPG